MSTDHILDKLTQRAQELGVSQARVISVADISVEDGLARICRDSRCPGYGLAPSCPPHVMKPKQFRQLLEQYESALVFKFDVPMEILFSEGRREVARVVHETSADLERLALAGGCISALGLAGGSCKPIFCGQEPNCVVISQGKECLHPDSARMSMSGLGINFNQICKKLGWQEFDPDKAKGRKSPSEGLMAGMVLVGWEESGKN